MSKQGWEPRDGDVLVVSYPEVKIPVAPYCTVGVGGLTYSRQLIAGDDVDANYTSIYAYLKMRAEADGREKVAAWHREMTPEKASKPQSGGRR